MMFKNNWNEIRAGWLILFTCLIALAGQFMFTIPGVVFLNLLEMSSRHSDNANLILDSQLTILFTQGLGTFGGIAAVFVAFRAINKKNPNKMNVQGNVKDLLLGLILGALAITILFFLLYFSNIISLHNSLTSPKFSSAVFVYFIIFILVSIFEEVLFRGYIIQTMVAKRNRKLTIYLTSASLFALAHLLNPNINLLGIINIFLMGLLFVYMFERTNSLLMPIGFHFSWNYFQGTIFGFPVSGLEPHGLYEVNIGHSSSLFTGGSFGLEASVITTIIIIVLYFLIKLFTKKISSLNNC